jgi:PKD repeat protein
MKKFILILNVIAISIFVAPNSHGQDQDSFNLQLKNTTVCEAMFLPLPAGNEVIFLDLSTSTSTITSWLWNFGDGNTSVDQNAYHIYAQGGTYNVSLTIQSDSCTSTYTSLVYVENTCIADFQYFVVGDTVQFADWSTSATAIQSWFWDFGDGTTSTLQNPVHVYNPGTYDVTLTIQTDSCISSIIIPVTISAVNPLQCQADFNYYDFSAFGVPGISFSDESIAGSPIISWYWDFGDGNNSTDQNPIHAYTSSGSYIVSLTIQTGFCTSTYTDTVWVSSSFCAAGFQYNVVGDTVEFLDNSTAATTIQSWFWNFGDGTTSTLQNPVHVYTPGFYDVTLTIQADSCISSVILPVYVLSNTQCQADFSYFDNTALGISSVSFTDLSQAGTPIISWFWNFGDGNTSTQQNPTHNYVLPGLYDVGLTIVTSDSCISTMSYLVYYNYQQSVNCDAQFSTVVDGLIVDFIDESYVAPGDSIVNWVWYFGDGSISTQPNPTHIYSTSGVYSVSLSIYTANCSDSYGFFIEITDPCDAAFYYSANNLDVSFFDNSSFSSSPITSWEWNFGDGFSSSLQNPTYTYASSGQYVVSLTITTSSNCSSTSTMLIDVMAGSGNTMPNSGNWNPGSIGCQAMFTPVSTGLSVDFFDQSISSDSITFYFWNFGDGNISFDANPSHIYAANGNYTVSLLIASNSCSSLFEMDLFVSSSSQWGSDCQALFFPVMDTGTTVNFWDMSLGQPTSWLWDFGDGNISTDSNPSHTYAVPGVYMVTLTVTTSNCTSSLTVEVDLTTATFMPMAAFANSSTSIDESTSFVESVNLYPNPATTNVNVNVSLAESKEVEITINDVTGREYYIEKHTLMPGKNTVQISINNLPPSYYFIKILSETEVEVIPFVKK